MEPGDPRRVEIIQKLVDQAKTPEERSLVVAAVGRYAQCGRAIRQTARRRKAFAGPLGECPKGYRQEPGGLRQDPAADGRLCPGDFRPQGRRGQDPGRLVEEPRTVSFPTTRRAPTRPRRCSNWALRGSMPGRTTTRRSGTSGSAASSPIRRRRRRRPAPPAASIPWARS